MSFSLKGSGGEWFRNLQADPHVKLRVRGGSFRGKAREITDADEFDYAKRVYSSSVNRLDWIEYKMHRADTPSADKIRSMHQKWFTDGSPVVVDLAH